MHMIYNSKKFIATLLIAASIQLAATVEYRVLAGEAVEPYLRPMAELIIKVLKEYPYEYEPEGGADAEDVDCYRSPDTIMVGAFNDGQLIALAIGLPLEQFEDKPCGFFPDRALAGLLPTLQGYFYVALLLVEKEYWHQGIGQQLMRTLTQQVQRTQQYTHLCTLVLERDYHQEPAPVTYDYYYERCCQRYFSEHNWRKHALLIAYMAGSNPHMRLWSVLI